MNTKDTGYRGIWYMNTRSNDEYVYKYSGGLGTYCAKHRPFAVYCPKAGKTFFCYGGVKEGYHKRPELKTRKSDLAKVQDALYHMVSYYDHRTGQVPRPTILLDKQTVDAHDNPVISVDGAGHIWIFSTAHGELRPAYIHKSVRPYDISQFQQVHATRQTAKGPKPITNFSYMQPWYIEGQGFVYFFTAYEGWNRRTYFSSSKDGVVWSKWVSLAQICEGHYQISAVHGARAATAFNYHPNKHGGQPGVHWRTNLYYMETPDTGRTWRAADGTKLKLPLTQARNPALVHDFERDGLLVYLKDILFDEAGHPVILFLTSKGFDAGPKNAPRTWTTARWTGTTWEIRPVTTSDNNYDTGSLYIEADGTWRLIGPTDVGPQPFNPGGEVAMWTSRDSGRTWKKEKSLTANSPYNHTYVRRPVRAHPDFYALWADGHGRKPSPSTLYFCNKAGDVFVLPREMTGDFAKPARLAPGDRSDTRKTPPRR